MLTTVLFDLDGTLLPMVQDDFLKTYLGLLSKKCAPHGYAPDALVRTIWKGTGAMVKNDGSATNEAMFWKVFAGTFGEQALADEPLFDEFYRFDFEKVRPSCGYHPKAAETVRALKKAGVRVALATNPVFPQLATEARIRWAGLDPTEFELYTTYENSSYCKPNPDYYRDVCTRLSVSPTECVMVGNNVEEDMVAAEVGMEVFLLTDCLMNPQNADISQYPHGGFEELQAFLKQKFPL